MSEVLITNVIVGERVRQDLVDLGDLVDSIERLGLLQPIVINSRKELVAGARRLEACRILGWKHIPARQVRSVEDATEALIAERDENTCRVDFTPSEMVALAARLEPDVAKKSEDRMKAGTASEGPSGNLPEGPGETREKVAAAVGTSATNLRKAKAVVGATEDPDPEVRAAAEEARDEMDATGKVDPAYQKVQAATGRRSPLNEDARRAAFGLEKAVRRVGRVVSDDRYRHDGPGGEVLDNRVRNAIELLRGTLTQREAPSATDEETAPNLRGEALIRKAQELADQGHSRDQIAAKVGCSKGHLGKLVSSGRLNVSADVMLRTRGFKTDRIVRESVAAIEGLVMGLGHADPAEAAQLEDAAELIQRARESVIAINAFIWHMDDDR